MKQPIARFKRGMTLIEMLAVVLILAVLVAVALPLYLQSVRDAEVKTCQTNMGSIASAVQAHRVRTQGPYFEGPVDLAAVASNGDLRDLHNALPVCPSDASATYTVEREDSRFIIRCGAPSHTFVWRDGGFQ